ncbi:Crp/Fnr family transcriptional regulator [Lysinibacillus sp. FSL H8-0500]|uniref:Crp/Fnr family transcriptional regulator n=1 Tax=Lysinibacillus sp. FSL H8-0500 TaxID=2921393 RepID=UPI003100F5C2
MGCQKQYCFSKVPIFQNLKVHEMEKISRIITHHHFDKGEIILFAGDRKKKLFIVRHGRAKVSHISTDGREYVMRILEVGDFFGDVTLFNDEPQKSTVEALEKMEICSLDGKELMKILAGTPITLFHMLAQLSARLEETENHLSEAISKEVSERLAAFILKSANSAKSDTFLLTLSKKDLASLLNTTRETLSRRLSTFQKKGYIEMAGKNIKIINHAALENLLL